MAKDIPTTEPTVFVAGMTWEWTKVFGDFPASDGWQLAYYFRSKVSSDNDITAAWGSEVTADGDGFEITIGHASTDADAGAYDLVGEITDGTKKHLVCNLSVNILPDPTAAGAKSFAKTMLDALDTALAARVSGSTKRKITVNGRTIEYESDDAMRSARAHYALIVELERNPTGRLSHAGRFVNG